MKLARMAKEDDRVELRHRRSGATSNLQLTLRIRRLQAHLDVAEGLLPQRATNRRRWMEGKGGERLRTRSQKCQKATRPWPQRRLLELAEAVHGQIPEHRMSSSTRHSRQTYHAYQPSSSNRSPASSLHSLYSSNSHCIAWSDHHPLVHPRFPKLWQLHHFVLNLRRRQLNPQCQPLTWPSRSTNGKPQLKHLVTGACLSRTTSHNSCERLGRIGRLLRLTWDRRRRSWSRITSFGRRTRGRRSGRPSSRKQIQSVHAARSSHSV